MAWIEATWEFLSNVHWPRVVMTVIASVVGVVFGIWLPGRLFASYTNQPVIAYVWYATAALMMVVVYLSMYGYGLFWELYVASEQAA